MQPVTYDIWHETFDIHAYKLLWIMQRKVPLNGTPKNKTYNNAKNMSDRHQCNFPQKYMQNNINNCSDFTCLMKWWQTGKIGRPTNKQTDIGKLHFPWYYYHKACHNPIPPPLPYTRQPMHIGKKETGACCFSSMRVAMDPLIAFVFSCSLSTSAMLPKMKYSLIINKRYIYKVYHVDTNVYHMKCISWYLYITISEWIF